MKKYIILPLLSLSLIAISCEDEAKEVSECAAITADFTSSMNAFNTYLETGDGGGESWLEWSVAARFGCSVVMP